MHRIALAAVVATFAARGPLAAQSTPTERVAAKAVLEQLDLLEAKLAPTAMADRMVARKDAERDRMLARVEAAWRGGMQDLSDWIGKHPESGWKEFKSVDTLTKVLKAQGYAIEMGVAGLTTAFVASWDSPAGTNGPTLGLIAEYDALRGTQGDFHGDQHNAQSPVAMAAAQGLMALMTEKKIPGRIKIYGTPAEEVGPPAKVIMWKAGVFKGADIMIRSHGIGGQTSRTRAGFGSCCLNINEVKFIFKGRPSHQMSSWNGRNALEAAVMFYTAVDHIRSSLRPEVSVQGVIPEGGIAPNVVPDRAVVDYYIRYPDEVYLAHVDSMMVHAAKGAAMATGTTVEIDRTGGEYRDGFTLGTLEELMFAYVKKFGAIRINSEPQRPSGYEESGWMARDIPGVGVTAASSDFSNHTYEMTADNYSALGHSAFLIDAKTEAAILYDFLTDAAFRTAVQTEFKTLASLFDLYIGGLKAVYKDEIGR